MKQELTQYLKFLYWGGYKSFSIKSIWISLRCYSCGYGLMIQRSAHINKPKLVSLGRKVRIDRGVSFFLNKISEKRPKIIIGNSVLIGPYCTLGCSNEIIIEDNVMLAPHVHITDRNHTFEDVTVPINKQPAISTGPVIIKSESWLGYGCQIMPNVTIGKHSVVAAGAIVTRDVPDYSVVAGMPARVIKKYNFKTSQWEKI